MKYDFEQTERSRYVLTGLLVGMIAVLVNFIFEIVFRYVTHYYPSRIINVSTIIFGSTLPLIFAGACLYFLSRFKGGMIIYSVLFIGIALLLAYLDWTSGGAISSAKILHGKELFSGMILIVGLFAALLVPYFITHQRLLKDII